MRGFSSSGLHAVSLMPASVPGTPRCTSAVAARPDHHGARSAEPHQVGPKFVLPAALSSSLNVDCHVVLIGVRGLPIK